MGPYFQVTVHFPFIQRFSDVEIWKIPLSEQEMSTIMSLHVAQLSCPTFLPKHVSLAVGWQREY